MAWNPLVPPRLWVTARPGWCLQYAQSVFNAPVMHETAWIAWQNQQFRHGPSEPLPGVPVLLWFSHWATYNGVYMNWGHVAVLVPGDAIYSSPSTPLGSPPSFERYGTIQEVERRFSSTYVGWSEDINGLRVAAYVTDLNPEPSKKKKRKKFKMDNVCVALNKGGVIKVRIFCLQTGDEHLYQVSSRDGQYVANVAKTYGCEMVSYITESHFDKIGTELNATRDRVQGGKR